MRRRRSLKRRKMRTALVGHQKEMQTLQQVHNLVSTIFSTLFSRGKSTGREADEGCHGNGTRKMFPFLEIVMETLEIYFIQQNYVSITVYENKS